MLDHLNEYKKLWLGQSFDLQLPKVALLVKYLEGKFVLIFMISLFGKNETRKKGKRKSLYMIEESEKPYRNAKE